MVGDHKRLYLPDLGRARGGGARFRGLRLIRTALGRELIGHDDLTDLSRLRLDLVVGVETKDDGRPGRAEWAHLVPDNPQGDLWMRHKVPSVGSLDVEFTPFINELEAEFEGAIERTKKTGGERAMIVYVRTQDDYNHAANLLELHELCESAQVEVAETYVQSRQRLDPKTAVGRGGLEEVELRALQLEADVLIFGQDLSPAQQRNVTATTQLRVVDRTQLILDIFAQRAQSKVGKLQVELAQLKYRLPRLAGRGTAMSRLAGGIGGRGPGETKLEIDRRRARDRIAQLERGIEKLSRERELRRRNRRRSGLPVISIVGYTNAGKSTLLNTLTQSKVLSEDKLFATLDPTTRRLRFPEEREVIMTDTVGFIRELPVSLKEAFRATLEELAEADLLLHVVDASDPALGEHIRSTLSILEELELGATPRLLVFNKADMIDEVARQDLEFEFDAVFVSATKRATTRELLERIDAWLIARGRGDVVPRLERAARAAEFVDAEHLSEEERRSLAELEASLSGDFTDSNDAGEFSEGAPEFDAPEPTRPKRISGSPVAVDSVDWDSLLED